MPGYIWPLSEGTTPDEINTSFGPRIDEDGWGDRYRFVDASGAPRLRYSSTSCG
jgi:hypothetical protein